MRKRLVTLVALAVILGLAIPAGAAELHPAHQGTSCKGQGGIVQLHFVNNKIPAGTEAAWLTVILDGGDDEGGTTIVQQADRVNRRNQQWTVTIAQDDVLTSAWTSTVEGALLGEADLDGMLVLSDYECKKGGTQEP